MASRLKKRGSALVLTMFTVAALLTLGTTFIVLATNESRMSQGDKDTQLARQMAILGVNWVTSYMGKPNHWGGLQRTNVGYQYGLADPRDISGNTPISGTITNLTWMGRKFSLSLPKGTGEEVEFDVVDPFYVGGKTTAEFVGRVKARVVILTPSSMELSYLFGQPPQYTITSQATIYRASDTAFAHPVAGRTVTARVRTETAADYALFESNMKTWDTPGFNTKYAPSDSKLRDYYNTTYQQVHDAIGIAENYTMSGDIRADGHSSSEDPNYAGDSGALKFYTNDPQKLKTIRFTGNNPSIQRGKSNTYGYVDSNGKYVVDSTMTDKKAFDMDMEAAASKGLPDTTGYIESVDVNGNKISGYAAELAGRDKVLSNATPPSGKKYGYVKIDTPPEGAKAVQDLPPGVGADIEYDKNNITGQPGVAKIKIKFNGDGTFNIHKYGAYSGKEIPATTNTQLMNQDKVPISAIDNGVIYVDGGNVEVEGSVDGRITIVAGGSTDRPTVTADGALVKTQPSKSIYMPLKDQSGNFNFDVVADASTKSGYNIKIPTIKNGKAYFPSWDPDSAGEYGKLVTDNPNVNQPTDKNDPKFQEKYTAWQQEQLNIQKAQTEYVTRSSALTREGNIAITGDVTKRNGASTSVGLIAQNYITLSDQSTSKPENGATLQVDAVLMSLQHSVQYGGFLSAGNDYYKNLGGDGTKGAGIPRPSKRYMNGTFRLNGSIIGQYADVESSVQGHGYTKQEFRQDEAMKDNLPPFFPQFDRKKSNAVLKFVILAWEDQGVLRASK